MTQGYTGTSDQGDPAQLLLGHPADIRIQIAVQDPDVDMTEMIGHDDIALAGGDPVQALAFPADAAQ